MAISEPGDLIATIPALLGFTPSDSLVIVALDDDGVVVSVSRANLQNVVGDLLVDAAKQVATAGPSAAIAAIVGTAPRGAAAVHDALDMALNHVGIDLMATHVVDRIATGERWTCACPCGADGVVSDPRATPAAVAAVVDGRPLYASREDAFAYLDHRPCEAVAGALASIRIGSMADTLRDVLAALTRSERDAADVALIGKALSLAPVRDSILGLAPTADAAPLIDTLADVAAKLPNRYRAHALSVLSFVAYCANNAPLAGEAAKRSNAAGRTTLTTILATALNAGIPPNAIRTLADTGRQVAADLGVCLPA